MGRAEPSFPNPLLLIRRTQEFGTVSSWHISKPLAIGVLMGGSHHPAVPYQQQQKWACHWF